MPPTRPAQISRTAWVGLIALSLIWGGSFLTIKLALAEIGPLTVVLHRLVWAALALWLYVWARGLEVPRGARAWGALACMGLLNTVVPFSLITWGQGSIETGLASILNATTAVFGVLVAAALLRDERLTAPRLAGVLVGLTGVAVTQGPGALDALDPRALAQYAVLAASLSYAFAAVWARTRLAGIPGPVSAAGMLSTAVLVMAPVALAVEGVPRLDLALTTWAALAYLSLPATAGAYLLYWRVLAVAGPGNLLLVTMMIPPVAILLGWLVLGERLAPHALAGFGLIALGLVLIDGRLLRRGG